MDDSIDARTRVKHKRQRDEQEAVTLAECDQRALERFQTLDHMEAEDEKNTAR